MLSRNSAISLGLEEIGLPFPFEVRVSSTRKHWKIVSAEKEKSDRKKDPI
jgi:hypothetical protein